MIDLWTGSKIRGSSVPSVPIQMVSRVLYPRARVGVEGTIERDNYNRIKLLFTSGQTFFSLPYNLIPLHLAEEFGACNDRGPRVLCIKLAFCANYMSDGPISVLDLLCRRITRLAPKWPMNIRIVSHIPVKYVHVPFKTKDEILPLSQLNVIWKVFIGNWMAELHVYHLVTVTF